MKRKGSRRNAEKERFWQEVIRRQRGSGQSVRAFCRDQALSEPSFYAWRRKLQRRRDGQRVRQSPRRTARRPAFVSVQLDAGTMTTAPGMIECLLPSGAVLRWPIDIEPAFVAATVNAWERE